MNKKLSHLFFVAILAFAMLIPLFPQSAAAQTTGGSTTVTRIIVVNQFNARAILFTNTLVTANATLGQSRLLFLTAADLGVPLDLLNIQLTDSGLPMQTFILANVFARAGGVPLNFVVDLINSGRNFGQIALALNLPVRLTFTRMSNFTDIIAQEIAFITGLLVNDPAAILASITAALNDLNSRFAVLQNLVGTQAFNRLLINRLAFETGFTTDNILALRAQMFTFTLADFTTAILARNTFGAINHVLSFDDAVLVTPGGIFGVLNDQEIPASLLLHRLVIIQKVVNTSTTTTT